MQLRVVLNAMGVSAAHGSFVFPDNGFFVRLADVRANVSLSLNNNTCPNESQTVRCDADGSVTGLQISGVCSGANASIATQIGVLSSLEFLFAHWLRIDGHDTNATERNHAAPTRVASKQHALPRFSRNPGRVERRE